MTNCFFMFNWADRALVYPHPDTNRACSISVDELRAIGWKFNEADLRKTLPRADASRIARLQ
jgi:hypothetical protein